jgi:hypothetical protein
MNASFSGKCEFKYIQINLNSIYGSTNPETLPYLGKDGGVWKRKF